MGTFQDRLVVAIEEDTDVVTIQCKDSYYDIRLQRKTEEFGILSQHIRIPVEKATPGKLVGVIERLSFALLNAVQTVTEAQDTQD